jgi:hypothetical protein
MASLYHNEDLRRVQQWYERNIYKRYIDAPVYQRYSLRGYSGGVCSYEDILVDDLVGIACQYVQDHDQEDNDELIAVATAVQLNPDEIVEGTLIHNLHTVLDEAHETLRSVERWYESLDGPIPRIAEAPIAEARFLQTYAAAHCGRDEMLRFGGDAYSQSRDAYSQSPLGEMSNLLDTEEMRGSGHPVMAHPRMVILYVFLRMRYFDSAETLEHREERALNQERRNADDRANVEYVRSRRERIILARARQDPQAEQQERRPNYKPSLRFQYDVLAGNIAKEDGSAGDCVICQESFKSTEVQILSCGHMFHSKCYQEWKRKSSNTVCPICRKAVLSPPDTPLHDDAAAAEDNHNQVPGDDPFQDDEARIENGVPLRVTSFGRFMGRR